MQQATSLCRRARAGIVGVLLVGAASVGVGMATPSAHALGATQVEVKNLQYKPAKLQVKPNATVTWVWKEKVAHNVVFDDKVQSKTLTKGVYTRKFTKAGTYKYKCTLHPTMKGEIVVK